MEEIPGAIKSWTHFKRKSTKRRPSKLRPTLVLLQVGLDVETSAVWVLYGYSFTVLRKNSKQMKEKMLDRFKFPDELKQKLVMLVVYQNRLPKELSRQYGLPNAHMLVNWVNIYKRSLEKGAITLPPMQIKKKKDTPALKQRIKQLEKSLEKANVMIYGLNAMIDYAEKELKVPVRKKHGTK